MKRTDMPRYRYDWLKDAWIITDWRWLSTKFPQRLK